MIGVFFFIDARKTPNPISRALPVMTWVENRTLRIDPYEHRTIDKSKIGDHYYSDKAPLSSAVAVIPYSVYGAFAGFKASFEDRLSLIVLLGVIFASAIPFFLVVLASAHSISGRPTEGAARLRFDRELLVVLAWFGSFVWVYASAYFGHVLAGALLLAALLAHERRRLILSGFALGLAFTAEFPLASAIPCVLAADLIKHRSPKRLLEIMAGVLPFLVLIALYNFSITRDYFKMPYGYVALDSFSAMKNAYGFRLPSLSALKDLLFSSSYGVFVYTPALIVFGYQFIYDRLKKPSISELQTLFHQPITFFAIGFPLLISSYYMWWGGWSYGPRHLIPFSMVLTYFGVRAYRGTTRRNLALIALCGSAIVYGIFVKLSQFYMVPDLQFSNTITEYFLPIILKGEFTRENMLSRFFSIEPKWALAAILGFFVIWISARILVNLPTRRTLALSARALTPRRPELKIVLILGVLACTAWLRFSHPLDIEYKGDERWMFDRTINVSEGREPWPALGMTSGAAIANPPMSVWLFIALKKLTGVSHPDTLTRVVSAMNFIAIALLFAFAIRRLDRNSKIREPFLWGTTLAAFSPIAAVLHRKLWAQSALPLFSAIFLITFMNRSRRWSAFFFGFIGLLLGQIHMSGFFYFAAFMLYLIYRRRSEPELKTVFLGALAATPFLFSWIHYLATTPALGSAPFRFENLMRLDFFMYWITSCLGIDLEYSLGGNFRGFLMSPYAGTTPSNFVFGLHVAAVLSAFAFMLVSKLRKTPFGLFMLGCFGFGALITLSAVPLYRHYLLVAFPLVSFTLPFLFDFSARGLKSWARVSLGVFAACQFLISFLFIEYTAYFGGAPRGDFGTSYRVQIGAPAAGERK